MSKRTRLKIHNFRLYMKKYVFNGRYAVRNILALMIVCTVAAAIGGVAAVVGGAENSGDDSSYAYADAADNQEKESEYAISVGNSASMNPASISMLAAGLDTDSETDVSPNTTQVVAEAQNEVFVVTVEGGIFVRSEASVDSEAVGSLATGDSGTVLSQDGEWLYISFYDITGYIKSEFALVGDDALTYLAANTAETEAYGDSATGDNKKEQTTTETQVASAQATTQAAATQTTTEASAQAEVSDNKTDTASGGSTVVSATTRDAISLSDADINLMASVMTLECGGESYEGQLAVANVILNRYLSGAYGSTMSDVCYASGQFSVVGTSSFNYYVQNGAQASCIQAAKDAIAGNNNIGSYTQFRPVSNVNTGSLSSYTIIGNHVFF